MKNKKSSISGGFTKSQLEPKTRTKKKKDTSLVIDVVKEVNKKKKPGKELMVLDKKSVKALKSKFGDHSDTIMNMLEMNNSDGGIALLQKRLLQSTIQLLPLAEEQMTETKAQKGVYQYATLVSQIRELITDIKSNEDRKYIAQKLAEQILRPAFMDLAQDVITKHHDFRRTVETCVKPAHQSEFNTELRKLATSLAESMSAQYKDVALKMFEALKS
jgi:hypothetical protein